MNTQEKLDDLREERNRIVDNLKRVDIQIHENKVNLFKEKNNLDIGDVIDVGDYRGEISDWWIFCGEALPVITLFKKDGTIGERKKQLYTSDITKIVKLR